MSVKEWIFVEQDIYDKEMLQGKTHGVETANIEIQKNKRRYDRSV